MGALTMKSDANGVPIQGGGILSIAPPTQGLPQPGESSAAQSALMQGLTNYFKGQTAAAGNPNATQPSLDSSLMQSAGNGFDNSATGGFVNGAAGNTAGNGYGAQAANWMNGGSGAAAGGSDAAGGAAADGSAADAMGSI